MENNLKDVEKELEQFSSDSKYCFKMCLNEWLIVMEKMEDTVTNEDRSYIVDQTHAKFRADKLFVVKIINVNNLKEVSSIENTFTFKPRFNKPIEKKESIKTFYKKGKIVKPDSYDDNIDNVCTSGIHYYKTIQSAFYYREIPPDWSGHWITWDDNGEALEYYHCTRGKSNCIMYRFYASRISRETTYVNGVITKDGYYNDELKKYGTWIENYPNGRIKCTGKYDNDKKCGEWTEYNQDGTKQSNIYYKDDIENRK